MCWLTITKHQFKMSKKRTLLAFNTSTDYVTGHSPYLLLHRCRPGFPFSPDSVSRSQVTSLASVASVVYAGNEEYPQGQLPLVDRAIWWSQGGMQSWSWLWRVLCERQVGIVWLCFLWHRTGNTSDYVLPVQVALVGLSVCDLKNHDKPVSWFVTNCRILWWDKQMR